MVASRAAVRRMLAARRRIYRPSSAVEAQLARLTDAERSQASKHLDRMGKELQSELVQGVDAYLQRPTFYNDQGDINRVLTFCGVSKGEPRDMLIWRSSLAVLFFASFAAGQWKATRCAQHYYDNYQEKQEKTVDIAHIDD